MKIECTKKLREYGKKYLKINDGVIEEDDFYNWSANLYTYFGKKCIMLMNHYSRLALFCYNVHTSDLKNFEDFCLNEIVYALRCFSDCDSGELEAYMNGIGDVVLGSKTNRNINSQMVELSHSVEYCLGQYVDTSNNYDKHEFTRKINEFGMLSIKEFYPMIRFKNKLKEIV